MTSDERLAAQVARELALPEPGVHFGATLLIATLVASPVLVAGATGRHSVPVALSIYAAVLVVVWVVAALFGSALSVPPSERLPKAEAEQPSPPVVDESVGSSSAH